MHRQQLLYRLQLHHDALVDKQINLEIQTQAAFFIFERHYELARERYASRLELDGQTFFINAFEQPRADFSMHFDRAAYDHFGQLILRHLRASASLR